MKPFTEVMIEERRLLILRLLAELKPDYRASSSNLRDGLLQFNHRMSRDQMHTELHWLAEQRLITVEAVGPTFVATLSSRGLDLAEGTAMVPGVKRFSAFD